MRPRSVLGPPRGSRAMVNDQLGDPCALPGGEDRDEAVHLAVESHAFEHAAAVCFHCAAEVVQRDSREPRDQTVRDP